jgi:hypothetical protein
LEDVFVRKLPLIALAGAASLALAGSAIAAKPQTHSMDVPLPDGSVAHIEYVGNVAPKVTVAPRPFAVGDWTPIAFPSFGGFDRIMAEMQRQAQEIARQAQRIGQAPGAGTPYVASYGNLPSGLTSTSVVSVSNGGGTCTRTTEVVSQGEGKPPKVTSTVSGNCAAAGSGAEPGATATPGKPLT